MPKMKTHSGAKKRFKKIGKGTIKRSRAYRRHLLTKKSNKRKVYLRKTAYISSADFHNIVRLLPY